MSWIESVRKKIGHELLIIASAGGWIENEQGHVLLQKRSGVENIWGFPGGLIEPGESASEAAVREIEEETGLITEAIDLLGVYSKYFYTCDNGDQCQTCSVFFRMNVIGGELKVDYQETFALDYFNVDELPPLAHQQHADFITDMKNQNIPAFR